MTISRLIELAQIGANKHFQEVATTKTYDEHYMIDNLNQEFKTINVKQATNNTATDKSKLSFYTIVSNAINGLDDTNDEKIELYTLYQAICGRNYAEDYYE